MRLALVLLLCVACHAPTTASSAKASPASDLWVEVVPLQKAQATEVLKLLEEVSDRQPAGDVRLKVVAHPDHNAVILSGTTAQVQQARELVAQVESRAGR